MSIFVLCGKKAKLLAARIASYNCIDSCHFGSKGLNVTFTSVTGDSPTQRNLIRCEMCAQNIIN